MPQRTATIESLPMAFAAVKEMRADGLEWGEGYRPLGRQALAEIIQGRMDDPDRDDTRPHRPQRLSHRAQGRVPAQAQQAAATRRRRRRQQSPGLKAGVHGRLRRLPGCKGGGARRHAGCEGLPPRPAGRLHAQEASHTLGSGWPKASPPTSPRGGSHRQIRERQRAGARPQHGQVLPEIPVR